MSDFVDMIDAEVIFSTDEHKNLIEETWKDEGLKFPLNFNEGDTLKLLVDINFGISIDEMKSTILRLKRLNLLLSKPNVSIGKVSINHYGYLREVCQEHTKLVNNLVQHIDVTDEL